ncbi:redoxin domain-containing protein [Sinorhizobium numidicum]|uniref:Redoxin domain-containing protein n=1 Tax=Sinorhizobium numidicum TaxID=680248 RepID=A0ABY8CMK5_9HYPH|nr:redoxin domain-containing protein [Sinorhizobium numidicum]WEX73908.1 redoxin domain-containing protein [Sinorhizobium numidicum]WEX79893.1 redoxin domain-containing protein [Sinorhizobium numidicum]
MGNQIRSLQPGEPAPDFALPAANLEGTVSLASLRGRPFLIGFFRGLHCPFCRRQLGQLSSLQPALRAAGVETMAVINTPVERARLYFRYKPTAVMLLCDPDCRTHRDFGVPRVDFLSSDSSERTEWPSRATMAQFDAARVNPTGELDKPLQPMEANCVLNAKDGFELNEADKAIFAKHGTQLVGHFLVNAAGIIGWAQIEARDGPNDIGIFPTAIEILAVADSLGDRTGANHAPALQHDLPKRPGS